MHTFYSKSVFLLAAASISWLVSPCQDGPVGWASFGNGTTGGAGGDTVIVTTRNELAAFANTPGPMVIMVQDTINMTLYERMDVGSNKTIVGIGVRPTLRYGGLEIKGDNVIVQNLAITDTYDGDWSGETHSTDALTIYGVNVWIDHCDLSASADGLLDIRADDGEAANFVTVSYTRFSNHNKVMLIGSSNEETEDRGKLKTTIHHCWFDGTMDRGLHQRMPRTRFGDVHIFNNYYEDIASYCSAARFESDLVVEANYYRMSNDPHFRDDIGMGIEDPELRAFDNIYELSSGRRESVGMAFEPSSFYAYSPGTAADVPAIVMNEAGLFNDPDNISPVAVTDTLMLDGSGGLKIIDVAANDQDDDGDRLLVARVINTPAGITLVRDNTVLYAVPNQEIPRDSVWYQLVDTQGGVDTGLVLVLSETSAVDHMTHALPDMQVAPNPAGDRAWVTVEDWRYPSEDMLVQVFDSAGSLIPNVVDMESASMEGGKYSFILVTTNLNPGVYTVVVVGGQQSASRKIVVAR